MPGGGDVNMKVNSIALAAASAGRSARMSFVANPRDQTLGREALNPRARTRCARGVGKVRGEAWAAVSPTGAGNLNV